MAFTVKFNDVRCGRSARRRPAELFQPGIPVVLEGRWSASGAVFESDRILVKHSEQYEADNGDRLADAQDADVDDSSP